MTTTAADLGLSARADRAALLEDKLRIPSPGLSVLPRARIAGLIDAAVSHPVTVLTGPPGAGKTVALAQWASARAPGRRPGWLSLDAADADPDRFWRYVTAALARAGAAGPGLAGTQARPTAAQIAQWLDAAARPAAEPVLLVLDGVQALAGSASLAELQELVRHEPRGLRLVLAGRCIPGFGLARLRLAGELAEVGAADLACTAEETDAFFAMLGIQLSADDRAQALRRTQGWLAGLRLTAMAADPLHPPDALARDYLTDEVLSQLPGRVTRFLLRTCLTPVVSVELARELTGESDAALLLEELGRETGLVQPAAAESAEYRYHPMLSEVLAAELRRQLPDEVAALHGRAARWHAERGQVLPAIRAAAEAGDFDFAVRLLRDAGPAVLLSPAGPGVESALAALPSERIAAEPVLAISLAAARLWQGDADGALPHLEAARSVLAGSGAGGDEPSPDEVLADYWLATLGVLQRASVTPARPGWLDAELALAAGARPGPRGAAEHRALGALWLALGYAALTELDTQLARSALLHASSQLSAGGLLFLRERGRAWEALACALYGDLAAADRLIATVSAGPHGRDDDVLPVLALATAAVRLARDEPEAAAVLLDQADLAATTPRPAGEPGIGVLSGLLRARLALAAGNLTGARSQVRWLTGVAAGSGRGGRAAISDEQLRLTAGRRYGLTAVIAALDAEISLASGELERARETLAGLTDSGLALSGLADGGPAVRAEAIICAARLMIADSDDKAALALVTPLLADVAGTGTAADRLAALLAAVVAHRRLGQSSEAAELLAQALALAEPEDACGPFVAAGPPVRSALAVLISPVSRCAGFAGRILDRFDARALRPSGAQAAAGLLTDSELAVLRLLPSHMTNQEIAEALFLSINTIKTHLSSIYRKLGVANRRQAIGQGRRLEML